MLKFKEILWYISWLSSGGQTERERERERETQRERKKERGGVNSFMASSNLGVGLLITNANHDMVNPLRFLSVHVFLNYFLSLWSPTLDYFCPVDWGCRIHRLLLCRGVPPPMSVLDMTQNNPMVWFQQCWSFGECGVPLHCHRSQVHSGPEW